MALSRGNVPARVTVLAAALVLGLLLAPTATTATASAAAATVAEPLCPPAQAGYARCAAEILVDAATGAPIHPAGLTAAPADQPSSPPPATGSPAWLGWAYDLQELSMLAPPVPDTVAIVDPYGDSAAESDLATYRSQFDLPACTTANGCFEKVDQAGGTNYPPDPTPSSGNDDWITETSLDLDMVSAICPYCHILLVQANTAADSDLAAAEETAEQTPAPFDPQQISNSWSWTGDFTHDAAFDDSGLAVVAATGDGGYNTFGIPAELPSVTAAGGTSLPAASDARGFAETAWSGTASGCSSAVFAKPTWQTDSACPFRTLADLSADADVSTGALAYDSIVDHGFFAAGGTSVASPIIAAYFALVGGGAGDGGAAWAYAHANALNDITSGSDGSCTPPASDLYLCTAQAGYDGPTGEGSVSGDAVAGPPQPAGAFAQVNGTDATLGGGVYANQFDTQTLFQYGTSTAYGQSTPPAYAGQALGVTPVGVTVTGLSPSTAYHFRLVATNGCGTSYGYDATFTAGSGAPTSTTTTTTTTTTSTATTTRLPCPTAATWSFDLDHDDRDEHRNRDEHERTAGGVHRAEHHGHGERSAHDGDHDDDAHRHNRRDPAAEGAHRAGGPAPRRQGARAGQLQPPLRRQPDAARRRAAHRAGDDRAAQPRVLSRRDGPAERARPAPGACARPARGRRRGDAERAPGASGDRHPVGSSLNARRC